MIEWPSELVEDLARRKSVLFLGAGVSANSVSEDGTKRPPGWKQFLEECLKKCQGDTSTIERYVAQGDYLTACELLSARLRDEWYELLAESFTRPKYKPAEIHRLLFQLDCRVVLTQNFDKIFDVYAQAETSGSTVVKQYYDNDTPLVMRRNYRSVIKVHGTIDEPSKTVFTRKDYARVRHEHRPFQSLVDALFLTHTFLFVGCSLADPDLRLFLEQHAHNHPSAPVHYMTAPMSEIPEEVDQSIRDNHNLRLLRYADATGHGGLTDSFRQLVPMVDEKRVEIASTMNW